MNRVMAPLTIGVSDAALSRQELFKTEFYNDWLLNQENIVAGPAMICHRSMDRFLAIAAPCRARDVDDTLPRRISAPGFLGPHIQRVVEIAQALLGSFRRDDRRCFNEIACAVVLVRRSGRVAHVNSVAERLLETCGVLQVTYREELTSANPALGAFLKQSMAAIREERFHALPGPLLVSVGNLGKLMAYANIFPADETSQFPDNVWSDPVAGAVIFSSPSGFGDKTDTRSQQDFVRKILRLVTPFSSARQAE